MHRNQLLSLILEYQLRYPEEGETIHRFISFIKKNKACFDRNLASGHVTGSAWVLSLDRTKVLLTHHRKLNKWIQLGGHADGHSDIYSAALREAYEESGLKEIIPVTRNIFDIDIHSIPKIGNTPSHNHYDVRFAFQVSGPETFRVSQESHDLSWVEVNKLHEITHEPSMKRMEKKSIRNFHGTSE